AAHLAGETTTTCHCWRAVRRDGAVLGFTDHDEDLDFDGTMFRAATGLDAAEAQANFGFAIGGGEVVGALDALSLTESDLAAGLWDSAAVETWLVNWRAPGQRIKLQAAEIGDVRRSGAAFTAELRSAMHRLDARRGRLFAATCDAELGDARCTKDVAAPEFRGEGTVTNVIGRLDVDATGLDVFEPGWFRAGQLVWTSGANAGRTSDIRDHRKDGPVARLSFWQPAPFALNAGDMFTVTAGCDKSFETCRARFANTA